MRAAIAPRDAIEEIWARDLVDNLWETLRLRRIKASALRSFAHEGLTRLLEPLVGFMVGKGLAEAWAKRERDATKEVDKLMKQAGLTKDAIYAETLAANLDDFERIDELVARTEARRNGVLREIDRRRDVVERRLRDMASEIEDAEFREISGKAAAE